MTRVMKLLRTLPRTWGWAYVFTVFGVVTWWVSYESPANLRVYVTAKARVYDLHADVPGLSILFDGQDIKEKRQVLSFYTLRFANEGDRPITQNMYDESISFGVAWSNGKVFPPETLEVSQSYLKDSLNPSLRDEKSIQFNKIVIDPKDYFLVRVLVLHDQGTDPELSPTGKIAGIDFDKVQVTDWSNKTDFWTSLRQKGYLVLLTLGVVLSMAAMLGVVGLAWVHRKLKGIEPQMIRLKSDLDHVNALLKVTADAIENERGRAQAMLDQPNAQRGE